VLTLYPTAVTTVEAFFRVDALDPNHGFVGFRNFRDAFAQPAITESFVNTIFYTVVDNECDGDQGPDARDTTAAPLVARRI